MPSCAESKGILIVTVPSGCTWEPSSPSNDKVSSSVKDGIDPITDEDFLAVGHLWGKPKMMKDKGFGDEVSLRGTNIGSLFVQEKVPKSVQ